MFRTVAAIAVTLCALSTAAYAADATDAALRKDGYGDVADLLGSMTPEQRMEVMKQSAAKQKELQAMPPEQVNKLTTQTDQIHDTLKVDEVDPQKLDVSKTKSTQNTRKDFDKYQQKYAAGKIDNAVVKPVNDNE